MMHSRMIQGGLLACAVAAATLALIACGSSEEAAHGDPDAGEGGRRGLAEAGPPTPDAKPADQGPDAKPADAGPCDLSKDFGPIERVAVAVPGSELNGAARFSPDELTIVFASYQREAGVDIYTATRTTPSGPFGAATRVDAVSSDLDDSAPYLTSDGKTLFFTRGDRIWRATRPTSSEPFSAGEQVPSLFGDGGTRMFGPYLDEGAQTLYYVVEVSPGATAIFRTVLASGETEQVNELTGEPSTPVISSDGLTMYFAHAQNQLMVRATRATRTAPFANEQPSGIKATGFPTWVSPDGCRLYFDRNLFASGSEISVATRPK